MESTTIEVRVRYAETDRMGHAHHTHHLVWCESARTEWLRSRGVSYARLEDEGVFLPISRVQVEYRGAVGYDEVVRIETWPEAVRSRSVTFGYRLTRESDGTEVAEAETELVCMDRRRRITRIPEAVRSVLTGGSAGG